MSSESINHHYVPRSILKQFKIGQNDERVFVYDKKTKRIFTSAVSKIGSENHFNTIEHEGKKINLEDIFQDNDSALGYLVNRITKEGSIANLSPNDLNTLRYVIATQVLRVKMIRSTLQEIPQILSRLLRETDPNFKVPGLSDEKVKKHSFHLLTSTHDRILKSLREKDILLILAPEDTPFVISDNPVALYNHLPCGEMGFSSLGVEIYFPISKRIALGLFCKGIYEKAKQCETLFKSIDAKCPKMTLDIINAVERKSPIIFNRDNVIGFFNCLQADNSSRFIYSSSNDFSFIPSDAGEKKSKFSVSEIGTIPRNSKMPEGKWFVIHNGYNSTMIKLLFHERNEDDAIVMTTLDVISARAVDGTQDARISVFDEGYECSMNRHSNISSTIEKDKAIIIAEDLFFKKINQTKSSDAD